MKTREIPYPSEDGIDRIGVPELLGTDVSDHAGSQQISYGALPQQFILLLSRKGTVCQ